VLKWFSGNILYVEDKSGWHVRPIDFEYSSYNYRFSAEYKLLFIKFAKVRFMLPINIVLLNGSVYVMVSD